MKPVFRKTLYALWIGSIVFILLCFIANPTQFSPENIAAIVGQYEGYLWLIYITLSLLRGFFMLPSSPFVIVGAILFPDNLLLVLLVSMIGVVFSASLLYYFSDFLGFSKYLESKKSKQIVIWKDRMRSPKAFWIVLTWSFFPFVPTDVICYVAGIVKMPYRFMILGVLIGELILKSFYVYFGQNIYQLLLG